MTRRTMTRRNRRETRLALRVLALVLGTALAAPVLADTPATGAGLKAAENPDASFIQQAGLDSLAAVELGRLALESASSPAVRDFARELIDDHDASIKGLRLVAARQKLALPTELDAEHKRLLDRLAALEGDEFDEAFVDAAADEHTRLIALLERAKGTTSDGSVRNYVRQQLPIARENLETAESIHLR